MTNHEENYKGFIIEIRDKTTDGFILIIDAIDFSIEGNETFGGKKGSEYESLEQIMTSAKKYIDQNL